MLRRKILFACLLGWISGHAVAKDLGVAGSIYPIAEPDVRVVMQQRLLTLQRNGELEQLNLKLSRGLKKQMDRPEPVFGLQRTSQASTRLLDPTIRMPYDLRNAEGNIVVSAGTMVNPFDTVSLSETLLFYNADDPEQVKWAENQDEIFKGKDKLILVAGSLTSQEQLFKKKIFFDQGGRLTTRFQIKHVPALVTQQGKHLKIEEVLP